MSLTPMNAMEEEHRRMSLKQPLAPVQETKRMSLKPTAMEGRGAAKSVSQKLDSKKRRTSRAMAMRRDFLINRRNTGGDLPETPDPEEILDAEVLFSRLQKMFIAAEEDDRTGLNIDEFKEAMHKTVGRHNTKEEIEVLFMKVDANCDGVVDWEEYVTYNLLEYKEKALMIEMLRKKPFPNETREIDSRHRDIIVKIMFFPNVRKTCETGTKTCFTSGKYVTLSKEGLLGIWSLNMRNLKYYNANHFQNRNTQPWFTDMVVMYNVNMLALTSTDRDIIIFDLAGKKFTMRYNVTGFENCITAMDYWVSPNDLNTALLLFGDTAGSVSVIRFDSILRGGLFGATGGKKNTCKRVSFPEVMKGFVLGVRAQKISNIHGDWVNKVQYLPDIDCFLSSCQSPQTALFFGDFAGKKTRVYFKVNKGVLSFDYSHSLNIIVTGGMDYMLRVWNPYVNNKAIVLLKGHTKPVNHVIINENRNQVISIDKGRSIRVFELRDQTCLQHISGRMVKLDTFPVSAVFFNAAMRTMLIAANQIVMLENREEEEGFSETMSHNKPVVAAMYSKVFGSVVSACQDSVVSVWDTNSGDKLMQFVNAHSTIERGVEIPVEITALCFDYNGRRLVTGARNGTVHVWNFNNGSLMQNFALPDSSDVTGIVCTKHRIYVSGWGKTVYIYVDGGGEEHRKNWKMQHKEDILSIAYFPPNMIVTGSYDGDIIVWSRETGQVYCRLNAFVSVKPITEGGKVRRKSSVKNETNIQATQSEVDDDDESGAKWQKGKAKLSRAGLLNNFKASDLEKFLPEGLLEEEEGCKHPLLQALDPHSFHSDSDSEFSRNEYDKVCKSYESAVEKIIFLDTREPLQKDTAIIVTSGAEGWIRFWSMHHEGGLIGQFNAAHRLGESVFTIKSDTNDSYLFTGDTEGYIKIWDIRDYCKSKKMNSAERKAHYDFLRRKFTFFRAESYQESKQLYTVPAYLKNVFASRPPPESSDPKRTLKYPMLVNSFRAHIRSIHSVDYVTDRELLITGSADCSIRIWTVNGQYIGTFGGEKWPTLPNIVTNEYFLSQIPNDIRRAGSARTLKVMHGGKLPMWQSAISIVKNRGVERLKKQFDHLQDVAIEVIDARDSEGTSNILGKSYKKKMRHRMPPTLPKFIETPGTVAVYHTLPFVDLSPVEALTDTMKEIQARRAMNMALNKLRGIKPKKPEVPAIIQLFNKIVNKQGPPVQRFRTSRIKKVADKYQGPLSARGRRQKESRPNSKASSNNVQPEIKVDEARDESHADLSESFDEDENPCDKRASSGVVHFVLR
ncbi:WD repeat-containing protein on Y chromosome-like [Mercenaria mercenaria]|uniref:WD repeat-containing protein on Y chromosome-like n=1 Tax=Mercenaria mercenaria TaxID=6596 RepID=UPI00234F2CC1|nr:WD repeat-containing protein on Y chromosome-like [Mercenaria mercenaria]